MTAINNVILGLILLGLFSACGSDTNEQTEIVTGVGDVRYDVRFVADWSEMTHPDGFPTSPHFSGLIGTTHNADVSFWAVDQLASTGIRDVAEVGSKSLLKSEINVAIQQSTADNFIDIGGVATSPGFIDFILPVKNIYSQVTIVSMLAPSPDWFVGITGLDLIQQGAWVENLTVELFAYDAGTDSGATYTAGDIVSNPLETIQQINTTPFAVAGSTVAVGKLIFTLQ